MKVRAIRRGGFYGGELRRPDAVFTLKADSDFRPSWMQPVPDDTPERSINGQDAIDGRSRERYGADVTYATRLDDAVDDFNPYAE